MKKSLGLVGILCCCLALAGCTAAPPDTLMRKEPVSQPLVNASTEELTPDAVNATLYFRYGDTGYLAPEERAVYVERNETPEKALVQALLDGPGVTAASLSPLFPADTEVLAINSQGDTLFVTFNEALLGRYADEPGDLANEPWKTEGALRRHLCMDALTATLTEAGLCSRVQVLVYRGSVQAHSMRLFAGYFDRSTDGTLLPAFTRNEAVLLTPHNVASLVLNAWLTRDWDTLYALTARGAEGDGRPVAQSAFDAFSAAQTLTGFTLSAGNVSPDGQRAVVCADGTLRGEGEDLLFSGYPVHLVREDGLWKIPYARLTELMNYKD